MPTGKVVKFFSQSMRYCKYSQRCEQGKQTLQYHIPMHQAHCRGKVNGQAIIQGPSDTTMIVVT